MSFFSVSRPGALLAVVALFTGLFWLSGCARPVGSLSGKITYQGKPLKGGSVSFISTDSGRSYSSGIKEDGTYSIPDLSGGEYKVCVETDSLKVKDTSGPSYGKSGSPPPQPSAPKGGKGAKGSGPPPDAAVPEGYTPSDPASAAASSIKKRYMPIPEKYGDQKTTDLSYSFKGGAETFDIDLK